MILIIKRIELSFNIPAKFIFAMINKCIQINLIAEVFYSFGRKVDALLYWFLLTRKTIVVYMVQSMKVKRLYSTEVTKTEVVRPNDTNPMGLLKDGLLVEWMDMAAVVCAQTHAGKKEKS